MPTTNKLRVTPYSGVTSLAENLPDLIEIQRNSFQWFLEEGLKEELLSFSPINDYSNRLELHFLTNYTLGTPKYTVDECRARDATYARPLRIPVRLISKETGEVKEQEIFVGDLPVMTNQGTFIINGAERVIVSQIVRSPGIARLNNMVQASVKTASPLPAPPAGLMKTGTMTYSETWLFTNDSRWRLRTLTLPQE